jgi:hypothetical protein
VYLRVFVDREELSYSPSEIRFDGFIGELLNSFGGSTGYFVEITMGINPSITTPGDTAGVLRMQRTGRLPHAI